MAKLRKNPVEELRSHIIIAADHAGLAMKRYLVPRLVKRGYVVEDIGAAKKDPADDYPDYAAKVARHVAKDESAMGVIICGTGAGMAIAANKVRGVRAALCTDEYSARMARSHNDANVIALRGKEFSKAKAWKVTQIFLDTPFSGEPRHVRRIKKIAKLEKAGRKR